MTLGSPPTSNHFVPAETLYRVSGISRANHAKRVRKGDLVGSLNGYYRELDLIESTVLDELIRQIGVTDASKAWPQLRSLLKQRLPRGRLHAVFDQIAGTAALVQDDNALADLIRGGGLFRIVPLTERLAVARKAVDVVKGSQGGKKAAAKPLRTVAHQTQAEG